MPLASLGPPGVSDARRVKRAYSETKDDPGAYSHGRQVAYWLTTLQLWTDDRPFGPSLLSRCRSEASADWRPLVMKQKTRRNQKRGNPKTILRLPDLEVARSAVLNSLSSPDAQRGYRHAIDDSWTGTAPNLGYHSARRWSPGIGCIWNPVASPLEPSTFVLERCAVLRTKLQIVAC